GQADESADGADQARDLSAVHEPHDLASSELVRSEHVRRRIQCWAGVRLEKMLLLGAELEDELREQWSSDRCEDEDEQVRECGHREFVAAQTVPGIRPQSGPETSIRDRRHGRGTYEDGHQPTAIRGSTRAYTRSRMR